MNGDAGRSRYISIATFRFLMQTTVILHLRRRLMPSGTPKAIMTPPRQYFTAALRECLISGCGDVKPSGGLDDERKPYHGRVSAALCTLRL